MPFVPTCGTHPLPPKGDHPKSHFPAVSSNTRRLEDVHLFPGSEHSTLYSDRLIKGVVGDTAAISPHNEWTCPPSLPQKWGDGLDLTLAWLLGWHSWLCCSLCPLAAPSVPLFLVCYPPRPLLKWGWRVSSLKTGQRWQTALAVLLMDTGGPRAVLRLTVSLNIWSLQKPTRFLISINHNSMSQKPHWKVLSYIQFSILTYFLMTKKILR